VAKIELGRIGAVLQPDADGAYVDAAPLLEEQGYGTIWLSGGPITDLDQVAAVVRATTTARVATGILAVDRFGSDEVLALWAELEASAPGRFVLGLGGAHGARPRDTLNAYLDRLDAGGVPADRRVLAALGPRMLALAAERAGGALPVLVTPGYTADARARVGDDTALAVEQLAVVGDDPAAARALARGPFGMLGSFPQYQASFRRQGFRDEDVEAQSDALVDALVPSGDAAAVAAHIGAQLDAGADHVAVSLVEAGAFDPGPWRAVADALVRG
jgi:probable F420-dependent oxidoreductase